VLELSSAQLYWLGQGVGYDSAQSWSPACAVITNITPNHFDWHGDMIAYTEAKQQITLGTQPDGWRDSTAILGTSLPDEFPVPSAWASHRVDARNNDFLASALTAMLAVSELPLRDPIAGASDDLMPNVDAGDVATGQSASLIADSIVGMAQRAGEELAAAYARAVVTFRGLPHRLEYVGEFDCVRAYNDSKCTTPEGVVMAIRSVCDSPDIEPSHIRLICGGYDKGTDLSPMMDAANSCAAVYALGQTAPSILEQASNAIRYTTLEEAVGAAMQDSKPGDVILLSPGCASWGQFTNYEERGHRFKAAISP